MICSVLHISVLFKNFRRMCYTLSNLFLLNFCFYILVLLKSACILELLVGDSSVGSVFFFHNGYRSVIWFTAIQF